MSDMTEWQTLERGWWRRMLKPGTAVVISDINGTNSFSASVFVDGTKIKDSSFVSLDEAKDWADRALFEAFSGAVE